MIRVVNRPPPEESNKGHDGVDETHSNQQCEGVDECGEVDVVYVHIGTTKPRTFICQKVVGHAKKSLSMFLFKTKNRLPIIFYIDSRKCSETFVT